MKTSWALGVGVAVGIAAAAGGFVTSRNTPAPAGSTGTSLLLARASTPEQAAFIGNQAGGRVFLFLGTDDFWRDHARLTAAGVEFVRPPKEAPYGTVAVFLDLYGNRWDLVQFSEKTG
jgi:uncharacterized glyoxalase superfamily protein PhnB